MDSSQSFRAFPGWSYGPRHTANKKSNCEIAGVPGKLTNRFQSIDESLRFRMPTPNKQTVRFSTMDGPLFETPHAILRRSASDQTNSPPHRSISRGLRTRSIFLSSHTHFFSSLSYFSHSFLSPRSFYKHTCFNKPLTHQK